MTITKKTNKQNNMLFMLASLACGDRKDSQSSEMRKEDAIPAAAAVSDASDDDTSIGASPPVKEVIVARRRRRPIKKRILVGDYLARASSSASLLVPRKSLLESSIEILQYSKKASRPDLVESKYSKTKHDRCQRNETREADDGIPHLVCDDHAWKQIHSPLALPSFLPCPAAALRNVKSICISLEERSVHR
mmetsp:Transcript_3945/g.9520  ORF Transcript_3945/g.9520 Transcript_3945/m.9520 type:complete len:192 (-) Transcript_3945:217-792(-)